MSAALRRFAGRLSAEDGCPGPAISSAAGRFLLPSHRGGVSGLEPDRGEYTGAQTSRLILQHAVRMPPILLVLFELVLECAATAAQGLSDPSICFLSQKAYGFASARERKHKQSTQRLVLGYRAWRRVWSACASVRSSGTLRYSLRISFC
jgi:hypothetical protein